MAEVTQLMERIESGDSQAVSELFPIVYEELRRLAKWQVAKENPGQTLQATGLVHEAYLRLVGADPLKKFAGRIGFFSAASEAMRNILVEAARRKMAQKRGSGQTKEECDLDSFAIHRPEEVFDIHEALDALAVHDPQCAEIVKLHYFGGFSLGEIAEILGISRSTANRWWTYAKTWLRTQIENSQ